MRTWLLPIVSILCVVTKIVQVALGKPMDKTSDFLWLSIAAVWMVLTGLYAARWRAAR